METALIVLVFLGSISGTVHGIGVLPDSITTASGGSVMFTTTVTPPETPFLVVTWSFINIHGTSINIITSSDVNITTPEFTGRITLFTSTGSLEITGLTINDIGEYKLTIIPLGAAQLKGSCRLFIFEPVSNVQVRTNSTEVLEFSSSVRLTCISSGSSISILWMNGSSEVTASDRVQLTDNGSNLTIVSVNRYDQGPFRCHVSNPISNGTSDPVNLLIIFGPEDMNLTASPSQPYYDEGSDISLTCSVLCRPPAQFEWFLNKDKLTFTGPELRLTNVKMSQSGNYSCQAFNNRTMVSQTSQPVALTVLTSNVSNVVVTSNGTEVSESSSVGLVCSASGSWLSFFWLNGSSEVTAGDRVHLSAKNSTLTIVHVNRYDQGPYTCHVFNNFSNSTSDPMELSINYGPESTDLKRFPSQQFYEEGSNVNLSCSSVSRPAAHYSWFLNGDQLPVVGPELRLVNTKESHGGNYSCRAFNNKTLRYETSQPSVISVLVQVSNVSLTSNASELMEFSNSVSLTCSSSGSLLAFAWQNGSSEVTTGDRVQLTHGNSTLTIMSVSRYDRGPFRCNVSNGISHGISLSVNLVVQYGPDNVAIVGSKSAYVGDLTMLYCSTDSIPAAKITWLFEGQPMSGHEAVHTMPSVHSSDGGTYSCIAENSVTAQSHTAQHRLTVTDFLPCNCVPAVAVTAMITAGSCLVIAAVAGIIVCCVQRRKRVVTNYPPHKTEKCSVKENQSDMYKKTGTIKNSFAF